MAQQGSVKETSFGQLDACIKHGMFRVGQRGADIFHNMSDIVKLTVDSKHGRVYTLDGLKDLESKLVLITGSKDERRRTVDGFLDVSVVSATLRFILYHDKYAQPSTQMHNVSNINYKVMAVIVYKYI